METHSINLSKVPPVCLSPPNQMLKTDKWNGLLDSSVSPVLHILLMRGMNANNSAISFTAINKSIYFAHEILNTQCIIGLPYLSHSVAEDALYVIPQWKIVLV